jgi:hypothetical protein
MIFTLKTQKRGPSPGASVKKKTAAGAAAPGKTSTKGAAEKTKPKKPSLTGQSNCKSTSNKSKHDTL